MTRDGVQASARPESSPPAAPEVPTGAQWGSAALGAAFLAIALSALPLGSAVAGTRLGVTCFVGVAACAAAALLDPAAWSRVTLWPLVATLAATAASAANCEAPEVAVARTLPLPIMALAFPVTQVLMHRPVTRRIVGGLALLALALVAADLLWTWLRGWTLFSGMRQPQRRVIGSQANANDVAMTSILLGMACLAWRTRFSGVRTSIAAMLAAVCWMLAASRQALAGWCAALIASSAAGPRRRRSLLVAAAVAVAVAAVAVANPVIRMRAEQTLRDGLGMRPALLAVGGWAFLAHPLTGNGPGMFGETYEQACALDRTWAGAELPRIGMPWVHCLFLEFACDTGILGLAAYGATMLAALRRAVRARRRDHTDPVAIAAISTLAAIAVMGLVDLTMIKPWFQLLFWMSMGLAFAAGADPCAGPSRRKENA